MSQPAASPFVEARKEALLQRCAREFEQRGNKIDFPVSLDFASALTLVSNLQLALRHPGNNGPSSQIAREFAEGLIGQMRRGGYVANAELAELGFDPAYDDERTAAYPIGASSESTPESEPSTEIPGLTERDLIARDECVRLMSLIAHCDDVSLSVAMVIGSRLIEITDKGAGDLLEPTVIASSVETARDLMAYAGELAPFCACGGPHCIGCGCCAQHPCEGGCTWATSTLCSRCV